MNECVRMTRKFVLCLGPHRSGTSLAAAALETLGAQLGLPETPSSDENREGFFEHPEIVAFNEASLAELGAGWDSPVFDGAAALSRAGLSRGALDHRIAAAAGLIGDLAGDAQLAATKDPRLCLLLPLWFRALARAGYADNALRLVHVTRDPVAAARSQMLRQQADPAYHAIGAKPEEGAALWLSYAAQALAQGAHVPGLVVDHADLVSDPAAQLGRLATFLGVTPDPDRVAGFTDRFVDPGLYRSRSDDIERATVHAALPRLAAFRDELAAMARMDRLDPDLTARAVAIHDEAATRADIDRVASRVLDRLAYERRREALTARELRTQRDRLSDENAELHAALDDAETARADHAAQIEQLRDEAAALRREIEHSRDEAARIASDHELERARISAAYRSKIAKRDTLLDSQERRIEQLLESRSWRITAPLRVVGRAGQSARSAAVSGWSGLNCVARCRYRDLSVRNPRLASELRRVLRSLLRAGTRRLPGAGRLQLAAGADARHLTCQAPRPQATRRPLVSVIVPNYNHAPYLRQRLDSIYAQTYTNLEVLLMDDCSTDDSRAILSEYAARYPEQTRLIFNETNSGGAFRQWEAGLKAARGDLVWIAESDDWCTENLLEALVPFFENPAVQLAYVPTVFMDVDGAREVWSMDAYLADLGAERWHRAWVTPAPEIVRAAFAIRNIVPNAGSAVFRRVERLDVIGSAVWRDMRICGDWAFYLNLIRGGLMAYSPEARNYFRQHRASSSVTAFQSDSYYREHELVAREVVRHYRVDPALFESQRKGLVEHWRRNRSDFDATAFARCYDPGRIATAAAERKPAVLMAGYGFCAGDGEAFGIELANQMKAAGHSVSYLDCAQEPEEPGMRARLAADIPVITNLEDLNAITRRFDIDIVHSHHPWVDNAILDLLPEDAPLQTVVTLHGMYETIPETDLDRIVPRMLARTGHFVHVSPKNAAPFAARGADIARDFSRIDNALATGSAGAISRADLGLPDDAFVLTVASRAIPEKGWLEAIEAVEGARAASGRDIRLILLGAGPAHDLLSQRRLADHILLQGFQADTTGYFALSDMGLLPSRFPGESSPLVVIECLQAGRPMIASALGEIPRMLATADGETAGALIALDDGAIPVATLADTISAFAAEPLRHAAARARVAGAARKFDPAAMRARYGEVYTAVTDAQAAPLRAAPRRGVAKAGA